MRGCWHAVRGAFAGCQPGDNRPVQSTSGQSILLPPGEVAVGLGGVISVAGGTVAAVDVFTFPAGTQLTPEGLNLYVPPENTPASKTPVSTVFPCFIWMKIRYWPAVGNP